MKCSEIVLQILHKVLQNVATAINIMKLMSLNMTLLKIKPHKTLVLDVSYYLISNSAFLSYWPSLESPSPLIL